MTQLVLLGAGGHASVLLAALHLNNTDVIGYVAEAAAGSMAPLPYLGNDLDFLARGMDSVLLVNGVGSISNPERRRHVFEHYRKAGFAFAPVIHPSAIIAADAVCGEGTQIMAGAILQSGTQVGDDVIVNTGGIVDHGCRIGDHVHIATGARLAGDVTIGGAAHIGAGATVIQGIHVGADAIVAAGAVVIDDVAPGSLVMGVPARAKII
jgi:UDP-perosamine 4-acetyltransferase